MQTDLHSEMRLRPRGDYLRTATWQDVHVLTEHWQSDMAFFADELRFLRDLIARYMIWLTRKDSVSRVQKMLMEVQSLGKEQELISMRIRRHLADLALLMETIFRDEEETFREEHVELEEDVATFIKRFRATKKEVSTITEHIIESERLQHLLTSASPI